MKVNFNNFLFGISKVSVRELEARGLKVNMDKTKKIIVGREPAVGPQRGGYPCGVCGEGVGVNSVWCQGRSTWCHGRFSRLRNVNRAGDNYRCAACVRGPLATPREVAVEGGYLNKKSKLLDELPKGYNLFWPTNTGHKHPWYQLIYCAPC